MKKLFNIALVAMFGILSAAFTGCDQVKEQDGQGGTGDFSLSVKEVGADYVDISITAPGSVEMAYSVSTDEKAMSAAVLFKTGTVITVEPGQVLRIDKNIEQDTKHYLYAAAKLDAANYSELIELEFTTKPYEFSNVVTIVDTYLDGFKVHVAVPESVKEKNNVLRFGYLNVAMYNKTTQMYGTVDVERLITNGNIYGRYIKNDSTLIYNSDNLYEYFGDEVLDFHDDIFPNEPGIFMVGEFRWASSKEEIEQEIGVSGWSPSYIIPLYDWENSLWTGVFEKVSFNAAPPAELETDFSIDIFDVTPLDATIQFNPDDNVYQYIYFVLDDNVYATMLNLCGGEENLQWFISSTLAYYEGATLGQGPKEINATSMMANNEPLAKGTHYQVIVNAWGDAKGTSQKFLRAEFTTKQATKPRPVIAVTPVNDGNPYLATFNIKAAPDRDGNIQPIAGAYFGANYAREFQLMFNQEYTYESILKGNYYFNQEDLAKINSPEGLNYSVPTLDGETTRMAVYGCNDEYTFNEVDPSDEDVAAGIARGWADYKAPMAEGNGPVSAYASVLEKVEGAWTAEATILAKQKVGEDAEGDAIYDTYNLKYKSRVNISSAMPELPMPLPDSVYTLYGSMPTSEVDGMYEELQYLCNQFTEYRLAPMSRILCTGFIDFDYHAEIGRNDWRSPYDLFTASDYSSVDVAQILYDFGPKWFLEVREDGSVIVPFDSMYMPPMHNWPGYPFYVGGYSSDFAIYDATDLYPGFPVEIAEDGSRIVIRPIDFEGTKLYMNSFGLSQDAIMTGSVEVVAPVISEIVLTRDESAVTTPSSVDPCKASVRVKTFDGAKPSVPVMRKIGSMTEFGQPVKYEVAEKAEIMTLERLDRMMTYEVEKLFNNTDSNE